MSNAPSQMDTKYKLALTSPGYPLALGRVYVSLLFRLPEIVQVCITTHQMSVFSIQIRRCMFYVSGCGVFEDAASTRMLLQGCVVGREPKQMYP